MPHFDLKDCKFFPLWQKNLSNIWQHWRRFCARYFYKSFQTLWNGYYIVTSSNGLSQIVINYFGIKFTEPSRRYSLFPKHDRL
jgi:hypothetical protein